MSEPVSGDSRMAAARLLQAKLARQVVLRDDYVKPLRTVAGFVVGFEDAGATARAAAVLLDADSLQPLDAQIARVAVAPDTHALFSFRGLPALMQVLAQLAQTPDLALVGGHGIAHPRRLGIAAHFGVVADLPCIGVARQVLLGTAPALHQIRGAYAPLRDHGEQIGWVLRSKPNCAPLTVSPGHRVAMAAACDLVVRFVGRHRLPEPTRLAGRLA